MKFAYSVIPITLLPGAPYAASSPAADGKTASQKPDWKSFHAELERAAELQADASRREAEMEIKTSVQPVPQHPAVEPFNGFKPMKFKKTPADLVDGSALRWLDSALKQPIPYESSLRAIFRDEGAPEEPIDVGLVESGYNSNAVSSAGALGPWPFIDETGRRYGLKQSKKGDDRRNLIKSTRASARCLRDLHELLGDWKLAPAGYKVGKNRVLKAMQQAGTRDFWLLRSLLPQETAQYIPRALAAIAMAEKVHPGEIQGSRLPSGLRPARVD